MSNIVRFIFILIIITFPTGAIASLASQKFSDGSFLLLDLASAKQDGVHKMYVIEPDGEKRLIWDFTFIEGSSQRPDSMGFNGIIDAWKDGDEYTVLISHFFFQGSVQFLKINATTTPANWLFGTMHFDYPPDYQVNFSGPCKVRLTGLDTFTAQLGNLQSITYAIAGNGELFKDGKATGEGAYIVNGKVVLPSVTYQKNASQKNRIETTHSATSNASPASKYFPLHGSWALWATIAAFLAAAGWLLLRSKRKKG